MNKPQGAARATLMIGVLLSTAISAACSDNGGSNADVAGSTAVGGSVPMAGGGLGGAGASSTSAGSGMGGSAAGSAGAGGAGGTAGVGGGEASACVPPATDDMQPMMLSQTGCVNMADPTKPLPGFIPYAVRSPLWSDGAVKQRFLRLPAGGKIKVLDCSTQADACQQNQVQGDDGHWEVPIGTVLIKNFSVDNKIIETRLVARRSMTSWRFFSYEWNDAGTDATLLPDDDKGKDKKVGNGQQTWHYPGRQQCPQCHTPGAGFALGPSTPQLNSDFTYADGAMNQIAKLAQLGAFESPPKMLEGLPEPEGNTATLPQRALSYLQANCAICHRPAGEYSSIDLRWGTLFADTKLCDEVDRAADKVTPLKYRVVPGQPAKSVLSTRMHALDELRMPKIGSLVVDTSGSKLVDDWISSLSADVCPNQTL